MLIQDFLDLARKEFLAAPIDDLFQPPDDAQVAGFIDEPEISRSKPSIGGEQLGVGGGTVVITQMDRWPIAEDLAGLALREIAESVVDDTRLVRPLPLAAGSDEQERAVRSNGHAR